MKRVLFVAEAVTLAQVVRLLSLSRALDPLEVEVHFASALVEGPVFADAPPERLHRIESLSPAQVERAVARGSRIYSRRVLRSYVKDDLRLFDEVQPDLVVGDLRWSLGVSARVAKVPYAALINAYWSPHAVREGFPLPDHPMVKVLGERVAGYFFPKAFPWVLRRFAAPLNDVRREHGLGRVEDLLELLVDADLTLHPDVPELVPVRDLPSSHHFLGPVLWSPKVPLPAWWSTLPDRPNVYVTLGSSGRVEALTRVVGAVSRLPVNVLVATAGRTKLKGVPDNVFVADYLPGDLAAQRSEVVITNGGSSTGYQALYEGRPVLGLPWNLDQYLASDAIRRAGAGDHERSTRARPEVLESMVRRALSGEFSAGARAARAALRQRDAFGRFRELVHERIRPSRLASNP